MREGSPISVGRAVFLSDAHLNQDDLHTRNFLVLAEKAAAENAPLFLLGDMFDLWFGSPRLTFRFQEAVVERLRELRRGGLRLYYVEGNRDFYLKKHHEGSTFDAVSAGEMHAAVGSRTVVLAHGDEVNRGDFAYRFWKALSKNPVAYGALSLLPPSLVLPLADRLEKTLKSMNPRFKGSFPEKEIREFALRAFAAGVDIIVLGHFHTERIFRFSREPDTGVLAALPSWKEEWRYLYIAAPGDFGFRQFRRDAPLFP